MWQGYFRLYAYWAADAGRFYDQSLTDRSPFSAPQARSLIGTENSSFPGTFYLRYWQDSWKKVIFGDRPLPSWVKTTRKPSNYLKRILSAGFNGVYLDDVDAYQQFNSEGDNSRPSAALEMLLFIRELSAWAKSKKPRFLIVPQNGENLFNDALENLDTNGNEQLEPSDRLIGLSRGTLFLDLNNNEKRDRDEPAIASLDQNRDRSISRFEIAEAYFKSIDGLGSEDFFFKGNAEENNPWIDSLAANDRRLEDFKFTGENYLNYAKRGLPIFNVEYLSENNQIGIEQYRQVVSAQFQFTNPALTASPSNPIFTSNDLRQLPLVPLRAPSRGLDQPPALNLFN
ncbi:MAG: hypothetical protein HC781_08410 [Leptolyngbyaceae cyanobacterium CSU_1_4]|nr:hypothetical protein [Leptolyngbyaceae cyanobacterium CSU_1_4]